MKVNSKVKIRRKGIFEGQNCQVKLAVSETNLFVVNYGNMHKAEA
jgi:hypothetical protein